MAYYCHYGCNILTIACFRKTRNFVPLSTLGGGVFGQVLTTYVKILMIYPGTGLLYIIIVRIPSPSLSM